MAIPPYAHTLSGKPPEEWEPLFTPLADAANPCQREYCKMCEHLEPNHGHLNKVAWWTAKFASESPEAKSTHQAGLTSRRKVTYP